MEVSPTLRRRRLGRQIRERRIELKLSGEALARKIGKINQLRLSKVEIGKATLTEVQLRKVIEILQPPPEQAEVWHELWRQGDQLGWWSDYADVIPEYGETLVGLESDAVHIRHYIEAYVPSMLATEEYSHAVVYSSQSTPPSDMAHIVEFRMRRQHRLDDPNFRYTVVIAEGALHRHTAGGTSWRASCRTCWMPSVQRLSSC